MSGVNNFTPEEAAGLLGEEQKEEKISNDTAERIISELEKYPGDSKKLQECIHYIADEESDVERELLIEKVKQISGIGKTAIRADVDRIRGDSGHEHDEAKETQADLLIGMAAGGAYLFHDETRDGFASLEINGHRETHRLKSKLFRQWLVRQYYVETGKSPYSEAVRQALGVIEAKAVFDGHEHKLHLRVAEHDGAIWYDLANDKWQAMKISAKGWEVVDDPPILFRRFKNTASQVLPERGGSLELLKKYINFKSDYNNDKDKSDYNNDNEWLLMFACNVSSLIPGIPHAIPIFYGDKGSAKTTAQRIIRKLIDPAHRDTMTLPTDKNELALMLMTNYAPCFDNLDGLQPWQSDMLCQAATGGGMSKRELYSDMDEVILSFLRCPMLNGINLVASRDDLLDRSIIFRLERIDEKDRKEESVLWQEFERDRPLIMGALFDVMSKAISIHPTLKLDTMPRMADFARWGYAITTAMGHKGEDFLEAYRKNIAGAVEEAVMADHVSAAILEFMDGEESWEGTATDLLGLLNDMKGVDVRAKAWPKRPHTLSRRITKMKSALTDVGVEAEVWRTGTKRTVKLSSLKVEKKASQASQASEPRENGHSHSDAIKTEASQNSDSVTIASQHEPRENGRCDGNDGNDAFVGTLGESVPGNINNDHNGLEEGEI